MDEVRVLSPATVSNVVCGFDCLGFALGEPFDEMTVRKIGERGASKGAPREKVEEGVKLQ